MRLEFAEIPREQWHRIEEREKAKTIPVLKPGSGIVWSRSIIRAGYWLEYRDMPILEANRAIYEMVKGHIGLDDETLLRLMFLLNGKSEHPWQNPLTEDETYHPALRRLYRKVQNTWHAHETDAARKQGIKTYLRTFWYFEHELVTGTIERKVTRQIGEYVAGHTYTYYESPAEYDPPFLACWLHQPIYICTPQFPSWQLGWSVMVHPLDAEPV